jgi:chaperonin GroES
MSFWLTIRSSSPSTLNSVPAYLAYRTFWPTETSIVSRIDEGEQKVGGIIIPDSAKEKPQQGKVLAAGNGKTKDDGQRIALDVKPGDLILFGKYSGQEIKLDGEEFLIMREDEVLAVLEDGATKKKK